MNEHQPSPTTHHDLINLLIQDGAGEGLPKIAELLMNAAMLMERAKHIGAGPYERVEARNGHANGFKPRSFDTPMGGLNPATPQVRSSDILWAFIPAILIMYFLRYSPSPSAVSSVWLISSEYMRTTRRMSSATIKLFLPHGDAKSLRTAEISNWTGKAIAAPRTELEQLLAREELDKAGIYILSGTDPITGKPRAYIGEAEVIRERLKQHKGKEFWISAIVFVSKDENMTKAHVRYLESRVLAEAGAIGRVTIEQNQATGSKLPESDREDMEVFLSRIRQLLPVLGSDILTPITQPEAKAQPGGILYCRLKGAEARGQRTPNGFVVYSGSTAVFKERPSADTYPQAVAQRKQLIVNGTLIEQNGFWTFGTDTEFSSPSAAAAVIHGGSANGLEAWKSSDGKSLKQIDEQA